jgi:serine/threonine-protein kinase
MAPGRTPKVGSLFANRYRIENLLGQGAVGVVFGVRDEKTGVACALKLLNRPETRVDAARIIREARALMLISSPHVVRIFDVAERAGYGPYLVLERLNGGTLLDVASTGEKMPAEVVVRYALHVCDALARAHAVGVIHRDIKLSNLFLAQDADGNEDVLKVLDFGIAKVSTPGAGSPSTLTKEKLLGSPQFMSPEQLLNPRTVDARTDLWSLGVVLFRLLSGEYPFNGESIADVTTSVLKSPVPPLSKLGVAVPPALQSIVDRCLSRDLAARWSSAAELASSLRALSPGAPGAQDDASLAPRAGDAALASKGRLRRWAARAAIASVVLVVPAALAMAYIEQDGRSALARLDALSRLALRYRP